MKRRLLKLGVFLLLGAIVNVAVAWLGVFYFDSEASRPTFSSSTERDSHFYYGFVEGMEICESIWERYAPADWPRVPLVGHIEHRGIANFIFVSPEENVSGQIIRLLRSGWPKQGLHGWELGPLKPGQSTQHCFLRLSTNTLVPLAPLWPGFAINTIFYAAILWLVWIAPGKVRRFVRVRQHRCPACGFIIAPNTCANGLCSECGATLPGAWMRQASS